MTGINVSGLNGVNVNNNVSFQGKKTTNPNTTSSNNKTKLAAKCMLGAGALAAIVIGGLAIKHRFDAKAAEKALKEGAAAAGIEDVNLYKQMRELFGKVTKHDKPTLEWEHITGRLDRLAEAGKIQEGDKLLIMPSNMTKEIFAKQYGKELPENSIAIMLQSADEKKLRCRELILNNGLGESFKDVVTTDKVHVIPLEI